MRLSYKISATHHKFGSNRIPEPARRRLFCGQVRQRSALAVEGDTRPPVPIWRLQESIEGENASRLRGDLVCMGSTAP